jgi:hypothetical protein
LVFAFFAVFVVIELILLIKAIATVENPELHERYKKLMLHWPYALLTPYTIFKTNVLPRVFFGPTSATARTLRRREPIARETSEWLVRTYLTRWRHLQPLNSPTLSRLTSTGARWPWSSARSIR